VLVKLGGSIITEKASEVPRVRVRALRRLAEELAGCRFERLVVVHGAGSFGHPIVKHAGLDRALRGLRGRLAWAETQCWQNVLDVEVAATLGRAGIPAVPCQPSATAVMRDGRLHRMDLGAVAGLLGVGMVPVLFGVPCYDQVRGVSILSGDLIAPYVAANLGIDRVVHATDVDGVFDADPHLSPDARPFERIDRTNWGRVRRALDASAATDVTGGMLGKVTEMVRWAKRGVEARIVDGNQPGRLRDALRGRPVGTRVTW
jgi:isopentenyl phosphate kinase